MKSENCFELVLITVAIMMLGILSCDDDSNNERGETDPESISESSDNEDEETDSKSSSKTEKDENNEDDETEDDTGSKVIDDDLDETDKGGEESDTDLIDAGLDEADDDSDTADTESDEASSTDEEQPPGDGIWISPDGKEGNPGTKSEPLASLPSALGRAEPGTTIWVMAGTYKMTNTISIKAGGEQDKPIKIFAEPGGERPVFDFSSQPRDQSSARGFQISANYIHIKGVEIAKAGDNCINISGSHNTIENVAVHGCCDTGIQISASGCDDSLAAYNSIINCDSYENYDASNRGENADGFAAKLYIGAGNVFRGCRAWNNADDGWDLFQSDDVVVIEDCWAVANGKIGPNQNNTNGDGNGFKLGGRGWFGNDSCQGGAVHQVSNNIAIDNATCGFTLNNNPKNPKLTNCGGRGNGKGNFCSLSNSGDASVNVSGAEVMAAQRDSDGNLPPLL